MMNRRYSDAIRIFAHILVYVTRTRQYHTRSYQHDQIMKKSEQMYALLAICVSLCPQRVDEQVHTGLREKYGDQMHRLQRAGYVLVFAFHLYNHSYIYILYF
jgi:translation initiation factor 3 subunit L